MTHAAGWCVHAATGRLPRRWSRNKGCTCPVRVYARRRRRGGKGPRQRQCDPQRRALLSVHSVKQQLYMVASEWRRLKHRPHSLLGRSQDCRSSSSSVGASLNSRPTKGGRNPAKDRPTNGHGPRNRRAPYTQADKSDQRSQERRGVPHSETNGAESGSHYTCAGHSTR